MTRIECDLFLFLGESQAFGYRVNLVAEEAKLFFRPVDKHRNLVAVALDYRLSPDTTLAFAYDRNDYRAGPDVFHYTVPDVNGNEIKGIAPDTYFGVKDLPDNHFVVQTASLGLETKLSPTLRLSSQIGYYDAQPFYAMSFAANAQPNGDFTMSISKSRHRNETFSNTTYLNWTPTTGAVQHAVVGGVSWARTKNWIQQNGGGGAVLDEAGNPVVNNFFNPIDVADNTPDASGPMLYQGHDENMGLFVSDQVTFGDWKLLGAVRHSRYRDNWTAAYWSGPGQTSTSSTDPTLGVMVDFSPEVSVYASYGTGLEVGGRAPLAFNGVPLTNANQQMDPKKSRQVEFGVKTDLAGGSLTLDASIFRINKSAEFVKETAPGEYTYVQSGRQVHTGGEVRLIGNLTSQLKVTTGVQVLHAELTGDPATAGEWPQNVPRVNATFSGDYAVAAVPGLTLTAGAYHTGRREVSVPNIAAKAGAYTRFDLGARYTTRLAGMEWTGRLGIENVTDVAYYNVGWYQLYEFGAPRTVTGSVQVVF